jgi:hypothetical protein
MHWPFSLFLSLSLLSFIVFFFCFCSVCLMLSFSSSPSFFSSHHFNFLNLFQPLLPVLIAPLSLLSPRLLLSHVHLLFVCDSLCLFLLSISIYLSKLYFYPLSAFCMFCLYIPLSCSIPPPSLFIIINYFN